MFLLSKDYRLRAWNKLNGKWNRIVVPTLVVMAINFVVSMVPFFGSLATLIIAGPLSLGIIVITLKIIRNNNDEKDDLFYGFKYFGESFLLSFLNSIFISLWSLLFIIPGIVKSYSYSMSMYILADVPNIDQDTARRKSMQLMNGHKYRLFCLHMSFIGWILLGILTCGIGFIWIVPYMNAAQAEFYQDLIEKTNFYNHPDFDKYRNYTPTEVYTNYETVQDNTNDDDVPAEQKLSDNTELNNNDVSDEVEKQEDQEKSEFDTI